MRDGNREGIKELRPCDNRDFHDPLSQLVNFPLFFPRSENKRELKKNPYGLCTISAFVCYLDNFVPIMKFFMIY